MAETFDAIFQYPTITQPFLRNVLMTCLFLVLICADYVLFLQVGTAVFMRLGGQVFTVDVLASCHIDGAARMLRVE